MKINEIVLYFLGRASAYPATALALFLGGVYLLYAELRTVRKREIAQAASDRKFKVVVVGSGVGGVGVGIKLSDMHLDYVILEKAPNLGGTWHDNLYPGCACDVMSHLYSYSLFLNPYWSQAYSGAAEILKYTNDMADYYSIRQQIRFNSKVTGSTWNPETSKWTVEIEGQDDVIADVIISAVGLLHVPSKPDFAGAEDFKGEVLHTARWDRDFKPDGKKIAVIGTGATSVQLVPALGDMNIEKLTVFQRTATWAPLRGNYHYRKVVKLVFKYVPFVMMLYRWGLFLRGEVFFMVIFMLKKAESNNLVAKGRDKLQRVIHHMVKKYVRKVVKDPKTAAKLTPDYLMGCKRITPSDTYLHTFNKPNVRLVTDPIANFTSDGITTKSGEHHEFDTIVYATGFDLFKSVNAFKVITKDGLTLSEVHGTSPKAYLGITHYQCPNYYMIGGPGIVIGHNSVIFIGECQIHYIAEALELMLENRLSSIVLKESASEAYTQWVIATMKDKVFEGTKHCTSWYRNEEGFNWTFWPTNLITFWWSTLWFDKEKYDLTDVECQLRE